MRTVYAPQKINSIILTFVCRSIDFIGMLTKPFGYRGLYRSSMILSQLLPKGQRLAVFLNKDKFLFNTRDSYWLPMISSSFLYEREIEQVLEKIDEINYAFIDCGSNLGYWAVKVSGADFAPHPVVAIEPLPENFKILEENKKINNAQFQTVQAAIYSDSGLDVAMQADPIDSVSNVGAHIDIRPSSNDALAYVKTVTIKQVVDEAGLSDRKLVIKLDVEGAEVPALEGAGTILEDDILIMYEDHGKDKQSIISQYLIDKDFTIFWVSNDNAKIVNSIEQISIIKHNPRNGYNFFATRSTSSFYKLLVQF